MNDAQLYKSKDRDEYWERITRLVLRPRSMTLRAAHTVVSAAMYGEGCIEGTIRAKMQSEFEQSVSKNQDLLERLEG